MERKKKGLRSCGFRHTALHTWWQPQCLVICSWLWQQLWELSFACGAVSRAVYNSGGCRGEGNNRRPKPQSRRNWQMPGRQTSKAPASCLHLGLPRSDSALKNLSSNLKVCMCPPTRMKLLNLQHQQMGTFRRRRTPPSIARGRRWLWRVCVTQPLPLHPASLTTARPHARRYHTHQRPAAPAGLGQMWREQMLHGTSLV
mmetsp:Transcript_76738/g.136028  ORF Transcript_76738/g.136028 Transcript_76738/m.136028 type:complete len:200 (-) Transcript_76738:147-746(-)